MVCTQQNLKTQEAKETDVRSQGKEDWAAQEKHLQVTLSDKLYLHIHVCHIIIQFIPLKVSVKNSSDHSMLAS